MARISFWNSPREAIKKYIKGREVRLKRKARKQFATATNRQWRSLKAIGHGAGYQIYAGEALLGYVTTKGKVTLADGD